jgi:hypothetical protein
VVSFPGKCRVSFSNLVTSASFLFLSNLLFTNHPVFSVVQQPKLGLGSLIVDTSRSNTIGHTHTHARTHAHAHTRARAR